VRGLAREAPGERVRARSLRSTSDSAVGQGSRGTWARIAGGAATYFALVFGTGFLLGIIRVLWLVPIVGTRAAEPAEMPLMFVAIRSAARWTLRSFDVTNGIRMRLGIRTVHGPRPGFL
jgi:hypothetical protein